MPAVDSSSEESQQTEIVEAVGLVIGRKLADDERVGELGDVGAAQCGRIRMWITQGNAVDAERAEWTRCRGRRPGVVFVNVGVCVGVFDAVNVLVAVPVEVGVEVGPAVNVRSESRCPPA